MPESSNYQGLFVGNKEASLLILKQRQLPLCGDADLSNVSSGGICGISALGEPQPTGRSGMRGPFVAAARPPSAPDRASIG